MPIDSDIIIRAATPDDRLQLDRFPSAAPFRSYPSLVVVCDGSLTSYLVWRQLVPDEFEILHLETAPAFQRRGFGRLLVQELKKQNRGALFLEVRESNRPARQLYENEGFLPVGVRRQYYSAPAEDGIVMKFHP